jgi:hypothetical protein
MLLQRLCDELFCRIADFTPGNRENMRHRRRAGPMCSDLPKPA